MTAASTRRRAPAVQYPLERSAWLAALLLTGVLLGLLGLAVWWALGAWRHSWLVKGACGGAWLLAAVWAGRWWQGQPRGVLHWTGQQWELHAGQSKLVRARVQVAMDWQWCMLVRFVPISVPASVPVQGAARWLWLEARTQPERWMPLRCAVYSRADAPADSADQNQTA